MPKPGDELESIEMQLLLEAVARHYGFDFRNYSPASLKRSVMPSASFSALPTRTSASTSCSPPYGRITRPGGGERR